MIFDNEMADVAVAEISGYLENSAEKSQILNQRDLNLKTSKLAESYSIPGTIDSITFFSLESHKNIVDIFSAQAEYFYFSVDFGLKVLL